MKRTFKNGSLLMAFVGLLGLGACKERRSDSSLASTGGALCNKMAKECGGGAACLKLRETLWEMKNMENLSLVSAGTVITSVVSADFDSVMEGELKATEGSEGSYKSELSNGEVWERAGTKVIEHAKANPDLYKPEAFAEAASDMNERRGNVLADTPEDRKASANRLRAAMDYTNMLAKVAVTIEQPEAAVALAETAFALAGDAVVLGGNEALVEVRTTKDIVDRAVTLGRNKGRSNPSVAQQVATSQLNSAAQVARLAAIANLKGNAAAGQEFQNYGKSVVGAEGFAIAEGTMVGSEALFQRARPKSPLAIRVENLKPMSSLPASARAELIQSVNPVAASLKEGQEIVGSRLNFGATIAAMERTVQASLSRITEPAMREAVGKYAKEQVPEAMKRSMVRIPEFRMK